MQTPSRLDAVLAAKRAEIEAAVASHRPASGNASVAARAADLIAGQGAPAEGADLQRLLAEYRDLADTRLAEAGEVFGRQDDA